MYTVIDTYDGFNDVIGYFDNEEEAREAAKERCEDTDGECQVSIYRNTNKGYEEIGRAHV